MSGEPEKSRRRSSRLEFHFLAIQIRDGPVTAAVVANARTAPTVCDVMLEIFSPPTQIGRLPVHRTGCHPGSADSNFIGDPDHHSPLSGSCRIPDPADKNRDITTSGDIDDHWIVSALGVVVVTQLRSQPPRLAAHDRVGFRIVVREAAENGNSDDRFFEVMRIAMERSLNDETQKGNQFFGAGEGITVADTFQCRPNLRGRNFLGRGARAC